VVTVATTVTAARPVVAQRCSPVANDGEEKGKQLGGGGGHQTWGAGAKLRRTGPQRRRKTLERHGALVGG
jgi:hypothetical protein